MKGSDIMAKKGFVKVVGHAIKLKNFRRETNGLMPFFEKLRITKEQEDNLAYLLESGQLIEVTISQTQKTLDDLGGLFKEEGQQQGEAV
jgi:hypothetical protein